MEKNVINFSNFNFFFIEMSSVSHINSKYQVAKNLLKNYGHKKLIDLIKTVNPNYFN